MATLKKQLLSAHAKIEGVEDRPSPVAGGTALSCFGKEFGHFHSDNELDLRLSRKIIQAQRPEHPSGSIQHPTRSPSWPRIEVRFTTPKDVVHVAELVRLAIAEL